MATTETGDEPQFVDYIELSQMYSGDYDVPLSKLAEDLDFRSQDHPSYDRPGTSQRYVDKLAKSIAANGMREPIEVRGGNVVTDGHHRALAAMKLHMWQVPVRHIQ